MDRQAHVKGGWRVSYQWQIAAKYPSLLILLAVVISLAAALPFGYLVVRTTKVSTAIWARLWSAHIPGLLSATLQLVAATIFCTLVIGISAAWFVERTDVPGRRIWRLLLSLPLAIPAYIAALCWIILLRRGGVIEQTAITIFGFERGSLALPPIYNLVGTTLAISLCVYPYVYLPVAAALRSADRTLEEAARLCGRSAWHTFRSITLPLLAPVVVAGAFLVGLYALADFGTVSMLRYRTFTLAIYQQFGGSIDRSSAASLSMLLVILVLPLILGENITSRRGQRTSRGMAWRPRSIVPLGRWKWVAFALLSLLITLALLTPVIVLGWLSIQGWLFPSEVDRIWGINNTGIAIFGLNTLLLAVAAAVGALLLGLAPAYLAVRYPSVLTKMLLNLSKSAYALPGLIVGLSLVFVLNTIVPTIYGTLVALLFGFVIRLLPLSITTSEAALRGVPPVLEQAAHTLGRGGLASFRSVTLPLAAPGLLATWILIFITAMKELPTAILLRPPGFDTLPVRIWAAASESVYTQAAPPAFLLICLTMASLLFLTLNRRFGLERALHDLR